MNKPKPRLSYTSRGHITDTTIIYGAPSSGGLEDRVTETHRHPHKKVLIKSLVVTDLPNTQKQIQKGRQTKETKKYTLNGRTRDIPRKRTK